MNTRFRSQNHANSVRFGMPRACETTPLANHDELEMDSAALRNALMEACLQSPAWVKSLCLCQKLGLTPLLHSCEADAHCCGGSGEQVCVGISRELSLIECGS